MGSKALEKLIDDSGTDVKIETISFVDYISKVADEPQKHLRSIFQIFHDMINFYTPNDDIDKQQCDMDSLVCRNYDLSLLLSENVDEPFFADRIFANDLVELARSFKLGNPQNKIHVFEGPPGSGKSTFLNNLMQRLEDYSRLDHGEMYETVWRLDKRDFGIYDEKISENSKDNISEDNNNNHIIEVPCPSHDNPILLIPKNYRADFINNLIDEKINETDDDKLKREYKRFKKDLEKKTEYEWVLKREPSAISSSLFGALMERFDNDLNKVYGMLYARRYFFDRKQGKGINIYNSGDKQKTIFRENKELQEILDELFQDSNKVRYEFSTYAKSNNGVFALMDIKEHNVERLKNLHGVISDGVLRVGDSEEHINSLFIAVMNPEDRKNFEEMKSFKDRIKKVNLNRVLDYNTEVNIYKKIFGEDVEKWFMPHIIDYFAKLVVSTRLNKESKSIENWLGDYSRYSDFCDDNMLLLKIDLYADEMPSWIEEKDLKKYDNDVKIDLLDESKKEGIGGLSGRESIMLFNDFFSYYYNEEHLIDMDDLYDFFQNNELKKTSDEQNTEDDSIEIMSNFPDASIDDILLDSFNTTYINEVLDEVKASLFAYDDTQISDDVLHYLTAINYSGKPVKVKCPYTSKNIEVTKDFLSSIEIRLIDPQASKEQRQNFAKSTQKRFISETLTKEMEQEGKSITETKLYNELVEKYKQNIKHNVLDPLKHNRNFRSAIKDYDTDKFKSYDIRIQKEVNNLMHNLSKQYNYTKEGAKKATLYIVDSLDLA